MMLTQVIRAASERMAGVDVEVNRTLGTVVMRDRAGEHEDIFMQGDEASQFIEAAEQLWETVGDMGIDACYHCLAEPIVSCLWN